ncbi:MAG: glycoside hydrolase domain-containing protein, partial [Myxococcota bacterium]|nr:glycoside hydrolase domain-containing protein [Myxococcota bacterium]
EPESLFYLIGDNALVRLEQMFDVMEAMDGEFPGLPESWYWHGNEPGLHIPWLFAVMGERELGNQWITWLMENRYAAAPTALAGNDDGGTLSAWYIFASMGFYPMAGTTRYVVGQSIWDRVDIPATGISIAKDGSDSSVWVDGEEWDNGYLNHGSFQTLRFGSPE